MNAAVLKHRKELEKELAKSVEVLISHYRPLKIILFGSLNGSKITETSDIDLLILKETTKRYWDRIDEVLHLIHPREAIDIFVLTPEEVKNSLKKNNLYLKEIIEKGKIIYERTV